MACVRTSISFDGDPEIAFSQYVRETNGLVDIQDIQDSIAQLVDQMILDGKIRGHIEADGDETWSVPYDIEVHTITDIHGIKIRRV